MMSDVLGLVLSVLKTTPRCWIQMAETIPSALFRRAPTPGEWSAHECLQHMIDTERMVFPARVGYLLRGEDFPAFNPDDNGMKKKGELSPIELAKEFDRLRVESIKILSNVKPNELGRKAKHQELGMVSLEEMINEWAGHDLMHTVQGERAIMQVFIEGCGPWEKYFSDHVVGKN
jgi:DinB superfamily